MPPSLDLHRPILNSKPMYNLTLLVFYVLLKAI